MQKVEQHIITQKDPRWRLIDAACFLSKNLYNAALYDLRQHFFATDKSKSYNQLAPPDPQKTAGIDVGLNNLAAVTSNQTGFRSLLVNGRPLKSINQHYNQERARLQAQLPNPHRQTQ